MLCIAVDSHEKGIDPGTVLPLLARGKCDAVPLELGVFLNPVRICLIGPVLRKGQGHESHVPLVEILLSHTLSLVKVVEALHVFDGIQDMGVCKGQLLLVPVIKSSPAGVNRVSPAVIIGPELVQQSISVYILCYPPADFIHVVPGPVLPRHLNLLFGQKRLIDKQKNGNCFIRKGALVSFVLSRIQGSGEKIIPVKPGVMLNELVQVFQDSQGRIQVEIRIRHHKHVRHLSL